METCDVVAVMSSTVPSLCPSPWIGGTGLHIAVWWTYKCGGAPSTHAHIFYTYIHVYCMSTHAHTQVHTHIPCTHTSLLSCISDALC